MLYLADSALMTANQAVQKKISAIGKNNPSLNEWRRLSRRIRAMQSETMNKIAAYDDDIIESIDRGGDFFRAVAGLMQMGEKILADSYLIDEMYKKFNLTDYIDFVNEREVKAMIGLVDYVVAGAMLIFYILGSYRVHKNSPGSEQGEEWTALKLSYICLYFLLL